MLSITISQKSQVKPSTREIWLQLDSACGEIERCACSSEAPRTRCKHRQTAATASQADPTPAFCGAPRFSRPAPSLPFPARQHLSQYSCSRFGMNPMGGMPGAPSLWQEARNADGRVYYYNVQTKQTQWAKPFELMTPIEVRMDDHLSSLNTGLTSTLRSARWQISHGRNTLLRVDVNTGTTQKQSRVLGRCQKFTRMLLRRLNTPKDHLQRKSPSSGLISALFLL